MYTHSLGHIHICVYVYVYHSAGGLTLSLDKGDVSSWPRNTIDVWL